MNVKNEVEMARSSQGYSSMDIQYNPSSTQHEHQNHSMKEDSNEYVGMNIAQTPNGGGSCFCGKVFSTYNYCRVHYIQVHGEDTDDKHLICLICQYPFAYDLNLKNHLKKEHAINGKLSLVEGSDAQMAVTESGGGVCLVCTKKFSTLNYCKVHYRSKHGVVTDDPPEAVNPFPATNQEANIPNNAVDQYAYASTSQQFYEHSQYQYSDQADASQIDYSQDPGSNQVHTLGSYHIEGEYVQDGATVNFAGNQQFQNVCEGSQQNTDTEPNQQEYAHQNMLKRKYEESSMSISGNGDEFEYHGNQGKTVRNADGAIKVSKTATGGGYCEVCGKMYSRIDTARSHYVQVHGEDTGSKQFVCLICNEGFVFELNRSSHLKQVHAIVGKLQLYEGSGGKLAKTETGGGVCLVCGAKYSRMDTLKSHFKSKHGALISDGLYGSPTKGTPIQSHDDSSPGRSHQINDYSANAKGTANQQSNNIEFLASAIKEEKLKEAQSQNTQIYTSNTPLVASKGTSSTKAFIRPVNLNLLQAKPDPSLAPANHEASADVEKSNFYNSQAAIKISATESGGGVCLICHTTFSLYGNCKAHYIKKHGENDGTGSNLCLVCERKFNFQQNLNEHLKAEHGVNGNLTRFQESGDGYHMAKMGNEGGVCLKCRKVFTLFGNLKAHFSKLHGTIQNHLDNKLPTFQANSNTPREFPIDYNSSPSTIAAPSGGYTVAPATPFSASHSPVMPTVQGIYKVKTENSQPLLQDEPEIRIAKTESNGGVCLVCNMNFSQYGNCKVHYIKKHGEDGVTGNLHCLLCQARFNFRSSFKDHMSSKHGVTGNLQRCGEYGETAMMAKDEKGGGACLICCKYFSQFGNLKVHFNKKHGNK